MKKFIEVLARHETAKLTVDGLTKAIGDELAKCPVVVKQQDPMISNAERLELYDEKTNKDKTHLWQAMQVRDTSSCGWGQVPLCQDGMLDALSEGGEYECEHCLAAYQLILHRKEARQELGIARRMIRHWGKQAMKMIDE